MDTKAGSCILKARELAYCDLCSDLQHCSANCKYLRREVAVEEVPASLHSAVAIQLRRRIKRREADLLQTPAWTLGLQAIADGVHLRD